MPTLKQSIGTAIAMKVRKILYVIPALHRGRAKQRLGAQACIKAYATAHTKRIDGGGRHFQLAHRPQ